MQNRDNAGYSTVHLRRLAFYSLGFFRPKLRKRLRALGYSLSPFGLWGADAVVVWGRKPVSQRGFAMAKRKSLPVVSIEDAFIRSIKPGWFEAPAGIILDKTGIYYESCGESDFMRLLEKHETVLDAKHVRELINVQKKHGISKYNFTARGQWTKKDYVLVVDQVAGDASITYGEADKQSFQKMLSAARKNYPSAQIIIRAHPSGKGHFESVDLDENMQISTEPTNPWDVLEGAKDVFCVTSQMGFEAILLGHKPHVFGKPFYSGWGLTHDDQNVERCRKLSVEELYELVMIQCCQWFDAAGRKTEFATMLDAMIARTAHHNRFQNGVSLQNMRAWKRPHMARYFPKQYKSGQIISWGMRSDPNDWIVEDGFLRSRGLGAELVPPLSLVVDKKGIYFDPNRASDLEDFIKTERSVLELERAKKLREAIVAFGITKYNLAETEILQLPKDHEVILVAGQVEDDKSIILGATGEVKNTADLLKAVRAHNPKAYIILKPHPDVVAGLRKGLISSDLADLVYKGGSLEPLWDSVDHVATITSQTGFEALLRGKKVSTYGMPFYADWGLTQDYAPSTGRRGKASLDALVHATLIDYPIYYDPKERCISTAEIIVERLASGEVNHPIYLRAMTWVQQKYYRLLETIQGKNRRH